ncbi:MAG: protein-L-isoaspartate(D-aspartate) O-methyltransferase [Candidatus Omnitrophota bacterium]
MDYALLRSAMVEEQLRARGIHDPGVLEAFNKVERHKFVLPELKDSAYGDFPLSIGEGQTISQPYIVALMTECLEVGSSHAVLEIGTGSGYQAAILAERALHVYSIERHEVLASRAEALLKELGYGNISIMTGDGTLGWQEYAPFDRIIVTAAAPRVPLPLLEQLRNGGKLVMPLGGSFGQVLTLAEKERDKITYRKICDCVFVPLVGKYGAKVNN